ncbi:MAG: urate hydroxylase PuuD [Candidatus Eremiobacteraeota bacterium]|nr:urate hydroxylase PuuD [Candidatus Eremiobacteraeota bacterium]
MNETLLDWLNLIARWAHLIAGISWIGASFYFVWLDDSLNAPESADDARRGVSGELWAVHGGGFYHNRKYPTGPRGEPLPLDLHWFKWEAYSTWFTGLAMLALIYWADASAFLIDPMVLDLTPGAAIAISIASLVVGWVVYDVLCRVFAARPAMLWTVVAAFLLFADWGLFQIFSGRAAYIHVGAIMGTIMVANVFFVIIPGQKKMLAQIRAGQEPDPRPGLLGKTRSVHNTYLTLPVLFIMISNHYPMTYGPPNGWLVLALIGVAGVLVRRFFVLTHRRRYALWLPAAAALALGFAALAAYAGSRTPRGLVVLNVVPEPVTYAQVQPILARRCAVCHAAKPTQPGFSAPPAGVLLDTPQHAAANAKRIYDQAVTTHAMPLGNLSHMTDAERALLGTWITNGAKI